MKKIEAYLKPFRLQDLRNELAASPFDVLRVHQAEEIRPDAAYREIVQGVEYETDVVSRVLVVLLVDDRQVAAAVSFLQSVARTDHSHDGHILISTVEHALPVDPEEQSAAGRCAEGGEGAVDGVR